jgi:hypothetical protein
LALKQQHTDLHAVAAPDNAAEEEATLAACKGNSEVDAKETSPASPAWQPLRRATHVNKVQTQL